MKLKSTILYAFLFSTFMLSNAQTVQQTEFGVKLAVQEQTIEIQFYNPCITRVIKYPSGVDFQKKSLSIVQNPQNVKFNISQTTDLITIKTSQLTVNISKENGRVSFLTLNGDNLLTEKNEPARFSALNDAGSNTFNVYQSFILDKEEAIYGLGQHQNGKLNQRGVNYKLVQGNTEDVIPFFQSSKGYGLFWDNYSVTQFTDNEKQTSFYSEVGDGVDYYFMYGKNADGVIAQMRELTGRAPMFPLWTFGFWQSRERYKTQFELVDVVRKYRDLKVPLDGIIQDWQYWGCNYLWNAMDFLSAGFQKPKQMIDSIHIMNTHVIISIWASFGPNTKPFKTLKDRNMLLNFWTWPESGRDDVWPPDMDYPSGVKVYDAYNPEARKIYWDYAKKGLFDLGIDGWWMDSTEPDHLQYKPSDMDNKTFLGSYRKVCNAFPLMTVGGISTNQRTTTSDKRVFILTRSVFAGQQRYGSNTWSGDITASWATLKNQIAAGLNLSMSGVPYWNSDIGGFFLGDYPKDLNNVDYRELYTRWIQFGTFCPMMRSHGTDVPREIYQFGKKGEPIYDAIEKSINLRYLFLPYIYSSSAAVTNRHSTMMRALVMDFPNDKKVLDISDQYMFGKSVLVTPITTPMYWKNQENTNNTIKLAEFSNYKTQKVYLPTGSEWFDFWTGERYSGGETVNKISPIDIIPLFIKAGTILPIGPKVQYATEKKWNNLEIRIFPGADSEFTLYEDENDNYNYEKGYSSSIQFKWNEKCKTLIIEKRIGSFDGMMNTREFNIVLVSKSSGLGDAQEKQARKVKYMGKQIKLKL